MIFTLIETYQPSRDLSALAELLIIIVVIEINHMMKFMLLSRVFSIDTKKRQTDKQTDRQT